MIDEHTLIETLKTTKNALLIEPQYRRKYLPLGLAKIATYIKQNGGKVTFSRECELHGDFDAVFVTSLFTYDSQKVIDVMKKVNHVYGPNPFLGKELPIYLGGVYASLMTDHAKKNTHTNIFKGYSKQLDMTPPDYTIDWGLDNPWDKFSFVFTSRGCPNKCGYCAVWRIEPGQWINPTWKDHIDKEKPWVMISDNNLSALSDEHLDDVIKFMVDNKKSVVFDNGFDCKHITTNMAKSLGRLKFTRHGMRLAFDRIEEDGIFQDAVKKLRDAGIAKSHIMAYVLFNFKDTPQEANYRMRQCVESGIRPYPQQYTPLNKTDRKEKFIGKYWTNNLLRIFRFFWLMAGYYNKTSFEDFAKSADNKKYPMKKEDWDAWHHQYHQDWKGK